MSDMEISLITVIQRIKNPTMQSICDSIGVKSGKFSHEDVFNGMRNLLRSGKVVKENSFYKIV